MDTRPVLSPVDYAAWSKGYLPPSEHSLIHELQFEGAKVVLQTTIGDRAKVWVVTLGTAAVKGSAMRVLEAIYEAFEEATPKQVMQADDLYGTEDPQP